MTMTQKELNDAGIMCSASKANQAMFTTFLFAVILLIGVGSAIVHTVQAPDPAAKVATK